MSLISNGSLRVVRSECQSVPTIIITNSNLIKSDIQFSYQLFQSTQMMGKGFVEIGEGLLFFPPDPVSHHLQLVYHTT